MSVTGVLVVDKPQGPTSHDVVAAARRALGEKRIGHTGTLDPMATGVLPLACGAATRLVRFLTASDKDYEAEVRLGLVTDTYDVTGREVRRWDRRPDRDEVAASLEQFRGSFLQTPPPYSAKKIGGRRAYDLARSDVAVRPAPAAVHVSRLEMLALDEDVLRVQLTCSAGFYVRSLAHDLGEALGCGACLQTLRRTRSGEFALAEALPMEALTSDASAWRDRLRPLASLLPGMPAMTLTGEGQEWVSHGRTLGPRHLEGALPERAAWIRLLSRDGALVALAEPAHPPGSLHPSVVLI